MWHLWMTHRKRPQWQVFNGSSLVALNGTCFLFEVCQTKAVLTLKVRPPGKHLRAISLWKTNPWKSTDCGQCLGHH